MVNVKCPNCGRESSGKFCAECGTLLTSEDGAQNFQPQMPANPKPLFKRWWFWVIVAVLLAVFASMFDEPRETKETTVSQTSTRVQTETPPAETSRPEEQPAAAQPQNIETTYVLKSGNYVAGEDIPVGTCNVMAVSGQGNLMSSNMFDGGVNEMFGLDDGSGFYTGTFNGLKLPAGTELTVTSGLVIQLDFSEIEKGYTGRSYDEANTITLSSGNYTAGTDFAAGIYKIVAVSGQGNLMSSNMFEGGVNEMFGVDDGSGWYNSEFVNAIFQSGVTLSITGGLTVQMIPAIPIS
jgi:hypothetical protein